MARLSEECKMSCRKKKNADRTAQSSESRAVGQAGPICHYSLFLDGSVPCDSLTASEWSALLRHAKHCSYCQERMRRVNTVIEQSLKLDTSIRLTFPNHPRSDGFRGDTVVRRLLQKSQRSSRKGLFRSAFNGYSEALAIAPKCPPIFRGLAYLIYDSQNLISLSDCRNLMEHLKSPKHLRAYFKSIVAFREGRFDDALTLSREAYHADHSNLYALNNIAITLLAQSRYDNLEWLFRYCAKRFWRIGDVQGTSVSLANMGHLHIRCGQLSTAMRLLSSLLGRLTHKDLVAERARCMANIAECLTAAERFPTAVEWYRKVLLLSQDNHLMELQIRSLVKLTSLSQLLGADDLADAYLHRALDLSRTLGDKFAMGDCEKRLAVLNVNRSNFTDAFQCLERLLAYIFKGQDHRIEPLRSVLSDEVPFRLAYRGLYNVSLNDLMEWTETKSYKYYYELMARCFVHVAAGQAHIALSAIESVLSPLSRAADSRQAQWTVETLALLSLDAKPSIVDFGLLMKAAVELLGVEIVISSQRHSRSANELQLKFMFVLLLLSRFRSPTYRGDGSTSATNDDQIKWEASHRSVSQPLQSVKQIESAIARKANFSTAQRLA